MRDIRGHRISIIFQEPATSLNPVMTVGRQITEVIERHTPLRGAAAEAKAIDWLQRVGIPEPRAPDQRLSVPDVRRAEAARDDRHRAGGGARHRDRRRADDGARRHDPGADPGSPEGAPVGAEDGDAPHHARSRDRRQDGPSRRADVRRPDRRSRGREGVLRPSAAPVRRQPVRSAAGHRKARSPSRVDRRIGAAAQPGVRRLPVCGPLRQRDGAMPVDAAAAARILAGPFGALSSLRRRRALRSP